MLHKYKKGRIVGVVSLALLFALLGFAFTTGRTGPMPGGPARPQGSKTAASGDIPAGSGETPSSGEIAKLVDVALSPQARLLAERFQCVCGCKDILAVCTCDKTPGSRDMKEYLQELVNEGRSPAEVEAAMIARYGQTVIP